MKEKSENEVAQLRPTPSDPIDCSLPGSSVHGIFQAWNGLPLPSPTLSPRSSKNQRNRSFRTLLTILNPMLLTSQCMFDLVEEGK